MTIIPARSGIAIGLLVVVGAAVAISLSSVLTPLVYEFGGNAATLVFFRFACFLVVCGLWLRWRGIDLTVTAGHRWHALGAGVAYTAAVYCLVVALGDMPVSLVILLFYCYPLLTRLVECALDRLRPGLFELMCLLTALIGIALCLGVSAAGATKRGVVLSILAVLGITCSFLWAGRKLATVQPTVQTFYMAATGLVVVATAASVSGGWSLPSPGLTPWLVFVATAVLAAAAFLGMFAGVRMIGPSGTAMLLNIEPVVTVLLAMLILGETLSPVQLLGATMVIASVFAAQMHPVLTRRAAAPEGR